MKLSDLRVGDIVQFRQGCISAVFINNRCDSNLCLYSNRGAFLSLDSFDENFKYCKKHNGEYLTSWDIVAVCKLSDHTIKRDYEIYDIIEKFLQGNLTKTDIKKIPWDWREEMSKEKMDRKLKLLFRKKDYVN